MSSGSLVYSNIKVCAKYDGQNRRFRLFTTIDPYSIKSSESPLQNMLNFFVDDNEKLKKVVR